MMEDKEYVFQCPVMKKCGGCDLEDKDYKKQLAGKQSQVQSLTAKYASVLPIIGMDNPFYYRNKVHSVFGLDRKKHIVSGNYQAGTHHIIPVEECLLEDKLSQEIIHTVQKLLLSFKIKTYDEDTGYGLFRHCLVRRGFSSGQVMVVLVLASPILPSKNNFVKALISAHPQITTIVLNVNNKRTSMVLGEKETVLYGKGYIRDQLCGCTFRISSRSFYQVNPVQTEILYRTAISFAGLTGKETVVDAYCGIGTIGIIASEKAEKVISVELNKDALHDARINARENNRQNVEFYQGDASEFLENMAIDGYRVDVVFLDPPRSGSDEKFLSSAVRLHPRTIVYISCNPETLARDLGYLTKHGYKGKKIQPVDMFPGTRHVETVVLLTRQNT